MKVNYSGTIQNVSKNYRYTFRTTTFVRRNISRIKNYSKHKIEFNINSLARPAITDNFSSIKSNHYLGLLGRFRGMVYRIKDFRYYTEDEDYDC